MGRGKEHKSRAEVLNAITTLCYEKKEFTLVSGKKSDFYIDLRRISFDGGYLYLIGRLLYDEIVSNEYLNFSVIAGVPIGGIPLISAILIVGFLDDNPLKSVIIRKEKKGYGKGNLIEPAQFLSKGSNIIIVEDVVTTGGSILNTVKNARNEGYEVTDAVCIVDRQEGGNEFLMQNGVRLHSIFCREDIVI
ncbi:orotate phosphoribosyltransferase [Candidatus Acidulodesulfobacterium sp. H_13]|uniref:orotate phosphoribosyltransferase n=1 Tax=Candidatus Acidulodesulfobacterium sp. H_13 TaxID=3395470 RepID=UPI003AF6DE69